MEQLMEDVADVDLALIAIPESHANRYSAKEWADFQETIKTLGVLQPVGIKENVDGGYIAVWGVHRILACQDLGMETIPARLVTGCPVTAEMATITENLSRKSTGLDGIIQHKRWLELHAKLHGPKPERRGGDHCSEEAKSKRADSALLLLDDRKLRSGTEKQMDRLSGAFTDDQLKAMNATGITKAEADEIIRHTPKLPDGTPDLPTRAKIIGAAMLQMHPSIEAAAASVAAAAGGLTPQQKETLAEFKGKVEKDTSTPKELPDKEWLELHCSPIRPKLVAARNHGKFDTDALLYRRLRGSLAEFKKEHLQALAKLRNLATGGPLTLKMWAIIALAHPRDWKLCTYCDGKGRPDPLTPTNYCGYCHGDGYTLKEQSPHML